MRIKATPVRAADLKAGDLFSTYAEWLDRRS